MIDKFSILNGAKYFSLGIFQNYLVFIPTKKYIKYFSSATRVESRKSNGMSEESIENITKSGSNFAPAFADHHLLPDLNFKGHCLRKNISIPKTLINLYISYTLGPQLRGFTIDNCLFGSLKLTKNADPDKYSYSGYGIRFDTRVEYPLSDGSADENVIIFGVDISSSVHIDNKGRDILILGKGHKD